MSATRESNEFSITVRPADVDGVEKYQARLLEFLERECSHYVVAYEQKGDLATQHFQCAAVFNSSRRADNLKASLVGILGEAWTAEQKKHAVCCNKNRKNNDIRLLAGGYCMKQDIHPFIKGWTVDELEPYVEQYEELKEKAEMRNVSRDNYINIMQGIYNELSYGPDSELMFKFERLSDKDKFNFMFKYAIAKGYDLQKFSTPVWFNYCISNFDVLFKGVTADSLKELLSSSRI